MNKIDTIQAPTALDMKAITGSKRSYQAPQLIVYGEVRQFTQGSNGGGDDGSGTKRDKP